MRLSPDLEVLLISNRAHGPVRDFVCCFVAESIFQNDMSAEFTVFSLRNLNKFMVMLDVAEK